MVVAKTAAALVDLSAQFAGRRVHKVYHALLQGRLEPEAAAAVAAAAAAVHQQQQPASEAPSEGESSQEEEQQQPELPLPELLQLQLQGRPAFTTGAAELADPCLEPATAPDGRSSGGSHSSGGDGSSSSLGLEAGVQVVELPLYGKPCYSLLKVRTSCCQM